VKRARANSGRARASQRTADVAPEELEELALAAMAKPTAAEGGGKGDGQVDCQADAGKAREKAAKRARCGYTLAPVWRARCM
jgi:hypothetical protein